MTKLRFSNDVNFAFEFEATSAASLEQSIETALAEFERKRPNAHNGGKCVLEVFDDHTRNKRWQWMSLNTENLTIFPFEQVFPDWRGKQNPARRQINTPEINYENLRAAIIQTIELRREWHRKFAALMGEIMPVIDDEIILSGDLFD